MPVSQRIHEEHGGGFGRCGEHTHTYNLHPHKEREILQAGTWHFSGSVVADGNRTVFEIDTQLYVLI